MAHRKETTGSIRTMRRTLMGGAVVSTLLIASLAPASAGCLNYGNLQYNYQTTYQQSPPPTQATPNQNNGFSTRRTSFGQFPRGTQLGWTPTQDFRINARYGNFNQEFSEPQANRGGRETFGGRAREGIRYDSPRFGAVVIPQTQPRYGNQTLQWGQGRSKFQPNVNLANQIERVNVIRGPQTGGYRIPNLTVRGETSTSFRGTPRLGDREFVMRVTPTFRPNNER